jgi:3'-phosphoadenosine 5'-phosphosulfate (PAPS) 3'-phosphatase
VGDLFVMSEFEQGTQGAGSSEEGRPLESLCKITIEACGLLSQLILPFYQSINSETAKLKSDKSVFTIADGIVQHLLINSLYSDKFHDIVGEEDESHVNIVQRPYNVDDLQVPEEYYDVIDSVRSQIEELSQRISPEAYRRDVNVFIDPIDGTREFSTGLGEQCSICIGFSNAEGRPIAGVVFRPLTTPYTFAAGAASENYRESVLSTEGPTNPQGLLTSNGSISPFIARLIEELGYSRVPSGGAGNKMLMLLEGKGGCYIQDRGVSRWDTCAAQAVIEAHGGTLSKLTSFIDQQTLASYSYLKATTNLDFEPGVANQTPYNSNLSKERAAAIKRGEKFPITAEDLPTTKAYSNLCGLFALDRSNLCKLEEFSAAIARAKAASEPSYD